MHFFAQIQTFQSSKEFLLTAAQIQQRRHGHISGNPGSTFQIEHLSHKTDQPFALNAYRTIAPNINIAATALRIQTSADCFCSKP